MYICRKYLLSCILFVLLLSGLPVFAQTLPVAEPDPPRNWYQLDLRSDGYFGISLKQAYQFIKDKKSKTVVVTIIDSGIDTAQTDLKSVLWTNMQEIAGNGKDDDHNGYIDDLHGWNFLGGVNGKNDFEETSEEVREYNRLSYKYAKVTQAINGDQHEYAYWLQIKSAYDSVTTRARNDIARLSPILNALVETSGIIKTELKLNAGQTFTKADIEKLRTRDNTLAQVKKLWLIIFYDEVSTSTNVKVISDLNEYMARINNIVNPDLEARKRIIGDDPDTLHDKPYGNNLLKATDCSHGTAVAGIIGAVRNNGYGIDGIADNVKLMSVKASPIGDEYDKDIANAIHYAVDNGARVVNMSFGKKISPHKTWVDEAFKYAAAHDVLLVIASGNDNEDMDIKPDYPNDIFADSSATDAGNVINVGASGVKPGDNLAASFTNYGKKNVDIFAPGVKITSIDTDAEFIANDGTSFSAPIISGVAALIMEYYPNLTAAQVKQAIMESATPLKGFKVLKPGTSNQVDFTTLSKSGGIVNAYKALQIASKMKREKVNN